MQAVLLIDIYWSNHSLGSVFVWSANNGVSGHFCDLWFSFVQLQTHIHIYGSISWLSSHQSAVWLNLRISVDRCSWMSFKGTHNRTTGGGKQSAVKWSWGGVREQSCSWEHGVGARGVFRRMDGYLSPDWLSWQSQLGNEPICAWLLFALRSINNNNSHPLTGLFSIHPYDEYLSSLFFRFHIAACGNRNFSLSLSLRFFPLVCIVSMNRCVPCVFRLLPLLPIPHGIGVCVSDFD